MKKIISKLLTVSALALLLSACNPAKVYNVKKQNFPSIKKEDSVYNAIMESGKFLGWRMKKIDNNTIIGLLSIRRHMAKVQIKFDKNSYNIELLEAENLKYDKTNDTIHKNYNGWIRNLKNQINNKLTPLIMNDFLKQEEKLSKHHKKNKQAHSQSKYIQIYDIKDKKFARKYNDINTITNKILAVGKKKNWAMTKQKDGFILAKVSRRVHSAIVRIDYNLNTYSLSYITSEKLGADEHYNIHKNYNIWVSDLEQEIDFAL